MGAKTNKNGALLKRGLGVRSSWSRSGSFNGLPRPGVVRELPFKSHFKGQRRGEVVCCVPAGDWIDRCVPRAARFAPGRCPEGQRLSKARTQPKIAAEQRQPPLLLLRRLGRAKQEQAPGRGRTAAAKAVLIPYTRSPKCKGREEVTRCSLLAPVAC
jgi:hypothetical protein